MDNRTKEALERSIEHWEENVKRENPELVDISSFNCDLCEKFDMYDCRGCPVKEKTGFADCAKTPYGEAKYRLLEWLSNKTEENLKRWREAAQKEVAT